MRSKMKHAVSLIVLVVTILVLSIIAAAVIISLSNANIMSQASQTVFKSDMANFKEAYEMYVIGELAEDANFDRSTLNVTYESDEFEDIFGANVSDKYKEGLQVVNGELIYVTEDETEKEILEGLGMAEVVLVTYTDEGVPIPTGFYYVGGTKATGLVISDEKTDKNKGVDADLVGNQFVWIPVEAEDTSTLSDIEEDMVSSRALTSASEPYTENAWEVEEYNDMIASVRKYNGFYIARFVAGDAEATANNEERTTITEARTVVSKKGAVVYNYVPWGYDMTTIEPSSGVYRIYDEEGSSYVDTEVEEKIAGAVYLSQNMYKNHKSVVSTLCYGYQWAAMLEYIDTYVTVLENSSESETDDGFPRTGYGEKIQNIYDLEENLEVWLMLWASAFGNACASWPRDVSLGGSGAVGLGRLTSEGIDHWAGRALVAAKHRVILCYELHWFSRSAIYKITNRWIYVYNAGLKISLHCFL